MIHKVHLCPLSFERIFVLPDTTETGSSFQNHKLLIPIFTRNIFFFANFSILNTDLSPFAGGFFLSFFLCVCACTHMYMRVYWRERRGKTERKGRVFMRIAVPVWKSEDNLKESILSFHLVDSKS